MADSRIQKFYSENAKNVTEDWHKQPEPKELYLDIKKHFAPNSSVLDVGCGSGRDSAWMARNNYSVEGVDSNLELLSCARKKYPDLMLYQASLPKLLSLKQKSYHNILSETVLMHLPQEEHVESIQRLVSILKQGGCLIISWVIPEELFENRKSDGRLYSAVNFEKITDSLHALGKIIDNAEYLSTSSGNKIQKIIFLKN